MSLPLDQLCLFFQVGPFCGAQTLYTQQMVNILTMHISTYLLENEWSSRKPAKERIKCCNNLLPGLADVAFAAPPFYWIYCACNRSVLLDVAFACHPMDLGTFNYFIKS